jgi:hypothetical protein
MVSSENFPTPLPSLYERPGPPSGVPQIPGVPAQPSAPALTIGPRVHEQIDHIALWVISLRYQRLENLTLEAVHRAGAGQSQ